MLNAIKVPDEKCIKFEDLFDLSVIQRIQDEFAAATGVASVVTQIDGTPITTPSNFRRLCGGIIRCTEKGRMNCYASDAFLGRHHPEGPIVQTCLSGGLWDGGVSITVAGKHIANWLIGQVRDETQNEEKMREYARLIGADEEKVLEAFREVPTMSLTRFKQIAQLLFTLANQLAENAYQNIQQARHIAERKQAEEALRESEKKFRTMVETFPLAIHLSRGLEQVTEYVNPTMVKLFGYTQDDIPSVAEWLPLAYPDEAYRKEIYAEWVRRVKYAHETQTSIAPMEVVVTCKDGSKKNISWGYITMGDKNYSCGLDLTERKRADAALRESEERFRAVVSNIPVVIFMTDKYGIFTISEGMGLAKLGLKPGQVVGVSIFDMYRDYPLATEAMKNTLAGRNQRIELEVQELVFDILFSPVFDQNGEVVKVIGVANDITESKEAEKEREKLQAQLSQSQKMESVGRLAGGVAHDFNNMLGVIIGHTEIALGQIDSTNTIFASLQEIQKAAKRSADLTRQLLAFARKQTVIPKVLDLNESVSGMLKMLERLIGENINLTWLPGKNLWAVKLDPSQIDQILANLCVNARDAINGVGKITIETSNITFDATYCALYAGFTPGEYLQLTVSDNGCGMSRDTLNKLFEPFFTTKEAGKGTGLGLATVYGIVKQNNGFINVYSELGQGTTFKIYLPRNYGNDELVKTEPWTEKVARGHETILLVEDEASILKVTKMILEHIGYTVLAANNPEEAIRLAQNYQGEMHLLITDVVMPDMNGRDLAKKMLTLYPHLKSLFMSGYTADVIGHHGMLDEGVHFIQKPFSIKNLADKIKEALDNV